MERKVKWGIIAAGGIARRRTLPALPVENAEVVAVMDTNPEALAEITREFGIARAYGTVEELLADPDVEAVYVASPVCFHREQALQVLAAGRHLLLEKPIGLDLAEARELCAAAEKTERKVGVAMVMRFHEGHRLMKEAIARGELGEIVSARAQLSCWFPEMPGNWRQRKETAGGGALVDMGVHCIDLLRYLLDDEPDRVYGEIGTRTFGYEVDDSADCLIHMRKGAACFVDVHFDIPDEAADGALEIYGTKGSFRAAGTIGQTGAGRIRVTRLLADAGYDSLQSHAGAEEEFAFEPKNPYAEQLRAFSEAILTDGPVPVPLSDALRTMETVDALYRSAAQKRAAEV